MSKGPLVRQTLAQSAERKKYMDDTEALKREREKDIVAYNALIEISNGRTNLEVYDIIERMKNQLNKWIGYTECHPFPYPVNRYGTRIKPPAEATAEEGERKEKP
jgi:hypothetical protein